VSRAVTEPVVERGEVGEAREGRRVHTAAPLLRWLLAVNVAFLPILVPRGPLNSVPADLPAVALIVLGVAALWRARSPIKLPLGFSYSLILIGGLLGTTQSVAPKAAVLAMAIDLYIFVWFLVLVNTMRLVGPRAVRTVAVAWVWTATAVGSMGVLGFLLGHERVPTVLGYTFVDRFERFSGTFRDPNYAGNYLVVSVFVVAASPWPRRWLTKAALCVPLVIAIHATRSNTALFALAAGVAVAVVTSLIRSRRTSAGVAAAVVALSLAVFALAPASVIDSPAEVSKSLGQDELFSGSLSRFDSSWGARVGRIEESIRLFGPDLLLGIGPSTTNDTLLADNAPILGEMHNDYVAALVERGLLGVFGVVSIFAIAGWAAFGLRRRFSVQSLWTPSALAGGLVSVAISGVALETLHFRHVWCLFALIFALQYATPPPDRDAEIAA
jgi:O-antigen ligase